MWMLRPQITTLWGCSALGLQRDAQTRLKGPAMRNPVRLDRWLHVSFSFQIEVFTDDHLICVEFTMNDDVIEYRSDG